MSQELKDLATSITAGVTGMKQSHDALAARFDGLQRQLDAVDKATKNLPYLGTPAGPSPLTKAFDENESVQRLLKDGRGKAVICFKDDAWRALQTKTVLTESVSGSIGTDTGVAAGLMTTGVLPIDRQAGITPEARQKLTIRNVLSASPTTLPVVDFVKVSTPLAQASPVAEGSLRPEENLNFSSSSERIKTVAAWLPASRQILDDLTELRSFVTGSLMYYSGLAQEIQMLSGDGTGENLHGILSQASSFNSALLPSAAKGWTFVDVLGCAIEQLALAKEVDPTFIVVNSKDYWAGIRLLKDGFGRYLVQPDPQQPFRPTLFGLDLVYTTSIAQGTFLVGSGTPAVAEIKDRMETVVEISTENQDYFIRGLIAVRAEARLALLVRRPGAFITGTFTSSPA